MPRSRTAATLLTALLLVGCTSSSDPPEDGPTPKPSLPPRVSSGVDVVVGGPDDVVTANREVIDATKALTQYMWDYFAYPAQPPDPKARALLKSDGAFSWSRQTEPDLRAPQHQGTVVLAVVSVRRSGERTTVTFCEDHARLVLFRADELAKPSPRPNREPTAVHTLTWVHTADPAVDENQTSDAPRWLADQATLEGEDPACRAAVAAVPVPSANPSRSPGVRR